MFKVARHNLLFQLNNVTCKHRSNTFYISQTCKNLTWGVHKFPWVHEPLRCRNIHGYMDTQFGKSSGPYTPRPVRADIGQVVVVVWGWLTTACSNKDYCSPVLSLESEAENPFPFFSRLLQHAREGLGCKHILRRPACWEKFYNFNSIILLSLPFNYFSHLL